MFNKIISSSLMVFVVILGITPIFAAVIKDSGDMNQKINDLESRIQELERLILPMKPQLEQSARQAALREKFNKRFEIDRNKYSSEQLREAEDLYQVANQKWGSDEAKESLQKMVEKYPDLNRTGCAILYMAQYSKGEEKIKYLQEAISKFNDCFYGDGVQVGVYARYLLAYTYKEMGETEKAEQLFNEIRENYPDAVDHRGRLLVENLS